MTITDLYQHVIGFYERGLWEPRKHWYTRLLFSFLRRGVITARHFERERLSYRASALTYSTLFSLVPLLAVIFAISNGFGLRGLIEQWIRESFVAQPEMIDTLIGFVDSYLSHTHGGVFLGFGLILLLWTLLNLTSTIESAFNQIWQVKRSRSVFRKVTDYTAVFFLFPIFVVVTVGFSIYIYTFIGHLPEDQDVLRPAVLLLVRILPSVLVALFFVGVFMFMPNTKVNFISALKAAIPTTIAFQLLQYGYVHSQVWLTSYNAIYGSFAALPLFMLMCQFAWTLALFGSTWAYVDQNFRNFYYGKDYVHVSRRYHDYLCVLFAASVCRRFARKENPGTADQLAEENLIHIRLTKDILYELCTVGILMEITNDEKEGDPVFIPAYDIHQLTLAKVFAAVDKSGDELETGQDESAWEVYRQERENMYVSEYWNQPLHLLNV